MTNVPQIAGKCIENVINFQGSYAVHIPQYPLKGSTQTARLKVNSGEP